MFANSSCFLTACSRFCFSCLVNSERFEIYHHSYWTTNYFKSRLGVSAFDLSINSIAFSSNNTSEILLKRMNKSFPKFEVVNPMDGVNESVNQICSYIEMDY